MIQPLDLTWKNLHSFGSGASNIILSSCSIETAPVPVKTIAQALGVQIVYRELGKQFVSVGCIQDDKPVIMVDGRFHEYQQRVCIAVQIGLIALGEYDGKTGAYEFVERYKRVSSYEFAGNLLMPGWLIDEYDYGGSVASYARCFKVPVEMARSRLLDYYNIH
jgi:Zn-dependent peptidase ImmA (M78 family)